MIQKVRKRLVISMILALALVASAASLVAAQDTSKLVGERCTECHPEKRWKDKISADKKKKVTKKSAEENWARIVDQMVRYGAELTPEENDLAVEYLAAASTGSINQPTTTTSSPVKKVTTTTTTKPTTAVKAAKTTTTIAVTMTTSATPTTVLGASTSVPGQQAYTGIEMIWYLLGGGMMVGSGLAMRNKDRQLK